MWMCIYIYTYVYVPYIYTHMFAWNIYELSSCLYNVLEDVLEFTSGMSLLMIYLYYRSTYRT